MDYEQGKAIPNNQILGKIERVIGKIIIVHISLGFLFKPSYSIDTLKQRGLIKVQDNS